MIDFDIYLWNRFECSGSIDDYLSYATFNLEKREMGQIDAYYN